MILPAAPEDAYPFERQGANRHLVGFALLSLGLVKGPRPKGISHGLVGPLDEGLMQEFRSTVAPVYPGFVPRAFCGRIIPCVSTKIHNLVVRRGKRPDEHPCFGEEHVPLGSPYQREGRRKSHGFGKDTCEGLAQCNRRHSPIWANRPAL